MKATGRCPKCGSTELYSPEPGLYNSFPLGFAGGAKVQRMVCCDCGYTEEWVEDESLERLQRFREKHGK